MSTTQNYSVSGMTCGHCALFVTAEVRAIPGVAQVAVDIATGQVSVTSDVPVGVDQIREAVQEAGYELAAQS